MTRRERTGRPGQGKSDPIDAVAIARITAREPGLTTGRDRRQLTDERTALANRTTPDGFAALRLGQSEGGEVAGLPGDDPDRGRGPRQQSRRRRTETAVAVEEQRAGQVAPPSAALPGSATVSSSRW